MGNYGRNNQSGGGYRSGGDNYRRRESGPRQMHHAVCDECGNDCEVPFRPSGDKPIYCSSCFEKREGGAPRRSTRRGGGPSNFEKKDNTNKELLEQVRSMNSKLERILKTIEPKTKTASVAKKEVSKKIVKPIVKKEKEAKAPKTTKKKVAKKKAPKKK